MAAVGIIIIYVVSCLVGGFMAGKIIRKDRYIWGIVTGLSYYVLLLLVSFLAQGKWDMTFAHALTTFFHVSWWRSHWWDAVVKAYKKSALKIDDFMLY